VLGIVAIWLVPPEKKVSRVKGVSHQIWAIWHLLQIWWLTPFT